MTGKKVSNCSNGWEIAKAYTWVAKVIRYYLTEGCYEWKLYAGTKVVAYGNV
jgi:hypothetical protein